MAYFCAVGNPHKKNQDRVLANGKVINDGAFHTDLLPVINCFVADGIGSMENSENAAQFVLDALNSQNDLLNPQNQALLEETLREANNSLVQLNRKPGRYWDSATTLCGLSISDSGLLLANVGDSEILCLRNDSISRINTLHVLDDSVPNSPITSYLGSRNNRMRLDLYPSYADYLPGDILIVTTDGLRKAISDQSLINILSQALPLSERAFNLYQVLIAQDVPDNLGAVFIQAAL